MKEFYACSKLSSDETRCNFFQWVLNTLIGGSNVVQGTSVGFNSSVGLYEKCNCGIDTVEKTVRKEGNNYGKQFLACSKLQDDSTRCSYFKVFAHLF